MTEIIARAPSSAWFHKNLQNPSGFSLGTCSFFLAADGSPPPLLRFAWVPVDLFIYLFISLSSALGIPLGSIGLPLAIGVPGKKKVRPPLPSGSALENQSRARAALLRLQQGQRFE